MDAEACAEEEREHAGLGELRHVRGSIAEEILGPVVLPTLARAAP
jgi:hypothetical protein